MSIASFTHFVFVDFENVPIIDLGLVAGQPVKVTLLIGKKQTWLDLSLVRQIHRLADQVELVEVGASGRNALDLTLACYLGQAVERSPAGEFLIISKDKDFEAMIGHLRAKGVKVARHESFAALPFLPAKKGTLSKPPFVSKPGPATAAKPKPAVQAKSKAPPDKFPKLLEQIKSGKHRPGTRARLMHHIHTLYGQKSSSEQLTAVIDRLSASGVISVSAEDKVSYF